MAASGRTRVVWPQGNKIKALLLIMDEEEIGRLTVTNRFTRDVD